MRVLLDLVHPADVRFFREPVRRLQAQGAEILCLARGKDVTCDLLEAFAMPFQIASRQGRGLLGLAAELVQRDRAVLRAMGRFRPDVAAGFGGVAIAHAGRLTGVRTVAFYDTEAGRLQMALTLPFIDEWHVPAAWRGPAPAGRTYRFDSFKELSDLHPARFQPCRERARALGLDDARANVFVRLSARAAAHDRGAQGLNLDALAAGLETVFGRVRLHLSCEGAPPEGYERRVYTGPPDQVHHLIAGCDLVCTDGASMAAEAAVLGAPAIVTYARPPGYVLELERYGLIFTASGQGPFEPVLARARLDPVTRARRRDRLLADKADMADYVVDRLVQAAGAPGR